MRKIKSSGEKSNRKKKKKEENKKDYESERDGCEDR